MTSHTAPTTGAYYAIGAIGTGIANKLIESGPLIHVIVDIVVGLSAILSIYFLLKNNKKKV